MSNDEGPLTHRLNASYFVGRATAFEGLVEMLLRESGERWSRGDGQIAGYLRDDLVPRLKKFSHEERKSQDRERKAEREAEENANG